MIKVIAKKSRKYNRQRVRKGDHFTILSASDFNVEWMTHAPNQTQEAKKQIIALAESKRHGIRND